MSEPDPYIFAIKDSNGSLLSLQGSSPGNTDWAILKPEENDHNLFKQLWQSEKLPNSNPMTFKLRSLTSGTLLTVAQNWTYGNNINGNFLYGSDDSERPWSNQLWTYEDLGNGKWLVKNFLTGTALESFAQDTSQWAGASNVTRSESQSWTFDYRSRTSNEISVLLKADSKVKNEDAFKHYVADGTYLNLPAAVRQDIWEKSMLGFKDGIARKYPWRNQIFDCDDFAIVMKAEVAKWAADNLKANMFALVMGICWGDRPGDNGIHAHHAFNWYLTPDLKGITWYEPQLGTQHDDAQGYSIYFGNF